jgi:potassium-dependent mechanosensitive channel
MNPRTLLPSLTILALLAGTFCPTSGQTTAAAPAEATEPPPADQPISAEVIQARIDQAEMLDEPTRAEVLKVLREAMVDLQKARAAEDKTRQLQAELDALPEKITSLRRALAEPLPEPQGEESLSAEAIEARLDQTQASLTEARTKQQRLENAPARRKERLLELPREIQQASQALTQLEPTLAAEPGDDPLAQARYLASQARQQLLVARAELYRTETQHIKATAEQVQLEADLVARQVPHLEKELAYWQEQARQARSAESQVLLRTVRRQRESLAKLHPLLDALTAENQQLVDTFRGRDGLARKIDRTRTDLATVRQTLTRLNTEFNDISRKIEIVGLNEEVGTLLRSQRSRLADLTQVQARLDAARSRLTESQLDALDYQSRRVELSDPAVRAEQRIADLPDDQRPARYQVETILATRKKILDRLISSYETWTQELSELTQTLTDLQQRSEEIAAYIDERVLWIRSTDPLNGRVLSRAGLGAADLVAPRRWQAIASGFVAGVVAAPLALAGWGIVLAGLWSLPRRAHRRFTLRRENPELAGSSFLGALETLGWTIVLALPVPVSLWVVGWILNTGSASAVEARQLGLAIQAGAATLLPLMLLKNLALPEGLLHVHLSWDENRTAAIGRLARTLAIVVVPLVILTELCARIEGGAYRDSLARLVQIVLLLGLTALAGVLARPGGTLLGTSHSPDRWKRYRWAAFLSILAASALLALLMAVGYLYTARQLGQIIRQEVWLVLAAVILYQVLMRGLYLARRDMARRQVAELKQTEGEQDKTQEQARRDLQESLDRVTATSTRLRRLVGLLLGVGVLAGSLMILAPVLPAVGALDRIVLWDFSGRDPVSLRDLLAGVLMATVVYYFGRSVPGLLDALILQRFGMESGKRYAITTVAGYLLIGVGVAVVGELLGIRWSNLQWIVAALGVGLGFGLQEIFANFVSGLILLLERPVRVGDMVTVGEVTGKVSRIQIRATTIVDFDLKELIIPNREFITGQLINWSLSDRQTRVVIPVGVAYGSDTELARQTLLDVAAAEDDVLDDPEPTAFFLGFGASSLDFQLRVFIDDTDKLFLVRHRLHMAIDAAFREKNITIAFPQQDVHLFFDDREALEKLAPRPGQTP